MDNPLTCIPWLKNSDENINSTKLMVALKLVHVSSPEPISLNDIIASFLRQASYMYMQGHSMCHIWVMLDGTVIPRVAIA